MRSLAVEKIPSYSLSALTNGAGLTGTGHNVNYLDMWMGYGGISQDVTFGFGTTKGVESIEIWNYNRPGSLERGVNNFNLTLPRRLSRNMVPTAWGLPSPGIDGCVLLQQVARHAQEGRS